MTFTTHPLKGLVIAEENARASAEPDNGIAALAETILQEGLQQPLCGYRKGKTQLAVFDGRRRLLALKRLADENRLPDELREAVPVRISDKGLAKQASLSAGLTNKSFHPAGEFRQFDQLMNEGKTTEEIAGTYHLEVRDVEKRLKLARLAPPLFEAFARDDLRLDQAQAFALSDDHARQVGVYQALGPAAGAHAIRRALTEGEVPSTDKRARFIGAEAYEKVGGRIRRDLFKEEGDFFIDAGLLDRMALRRLEEIAVSLREEGWSWTKVGIEADNELYQSHGRAQPEDRPFTDEEQSRWDSLQEELAKLTEDEDASEMSDEEWERCQEIEAALDELREAAKVYPDEVKATGGVMIFLKRDGTPDIVKGLVPHKAVKAPEGDTKDKPAIPHSVHRLLTEWATQGLARDVVRQPDLADAVLTASLLHAAFGHRPTSGVMLRLDGLSPKPENTLPVDHSHAQMEEDAAAFVMPSFAVTLTNIVSLPPARQSQLRAIALARSFDFSEMRSDMKNDIARETGAALAERLGSDPRDHLPLDADYFAKLPKKAIVTALREMGSTEAGLETGKKGDLVPMAARRAKQSGWLPEAVRFLDAAEKQEAEKVDEAA
ncbi:ParB N-terminal domain-containing protein [Parvularcula sp. ZS-1/3]|uniref:ParB N-terminal domain-containing protein n=1 Tax=Parvularcula mediterranea TaxID=2732508 RepID=A0A7Y3RN18_9PROT|nr:ParB N-terminal domain-containing protein [Parvularcula mediterranea]NNU17073.1 ParB N-terminal domain-containing protein [Parvularcula mediterranea]